MFPLKKRILIRGAAAHVAAGLGVGADYVAAPGTSLYAPFAGVISIPYFANLTWRFNQGGKWIRLTRPNGEIIEFAHNSEWLITRGQVQAGQKIILTGNTGKITTGPHCHTQIFDKNGKRLDPEKYQWEVAIDIPGTFKRIWKREGAKGDIAYFQKRLDQGLPLTELETKIAYWYGIVYPGGVYSTAGNKKWQTEKEKVL